MPEVKLERTIYAVGQGGFSSEVFFLGGNDKPDFVMVYDCGTRSIQEYLQSSIYKFKAMTQKKPIDLLCISHFDGDHVSGMKDLLRNNSPKFILMPLLDLLQIIYGIINTNSTLPTSIEWIYNIFHSKGKWWSKVILVEPDYTTDGNNDETETPPEYDPNQYDIRNEDIYLDKELKKSSDKKPILLKKGCNIIHVSKSIAWQYLPYYWKEDTKGLKKSLEDKLQTLLDKKGCKIKSNLLDALLDALDDKKISFDNIKEVYNSLLTQKEINTYSLCLYSGPRNEFKTCRKSITPYPCFCCMGCCCMRHRDSCADSANCLYLGDYDAKKYFNELSAHYNKKFTCLDMLQVPHHGSKNNWNTKLLAEFKPQYCLVQYGTTNKDGHPHCPVILDIIKAGSCPALVTEKSCDFQDTYIFKG